MPVTADSTLWTADTHCVTADGRIVCIEAERTRGRRLRSTRSMRLRCHCRSSVVEAATASIVDAVRSFSSVVEAATPSTKPMPPSARRSCSGPWTRRPPRSINSMRLSRRPRFRSGGGRRVTIRRARPFPVVGVGYGILPQLWGEAHGVVGVVGAERGDSFLASRRRRSAPAARPAMPQRVLKALSVAMATAPAARAARARA